VTLEGGRGGVRLKFTEGIKNLPEQKKGKTATATQGL